MSQNAPGSVNYALFRHMSEEHGLTLLESELSEIVRLVNATLEERLRWWITNAEQLARERHDLFEAGETLRAVYRTRVGHANTFSVKMWDAAAQPIRDMRKGEQSHPEKP